LKRGVAANRVLKCPFSLGEKVAEGRMRGTMKSEY
jgi:hypothetical protein